MLAHLSGRRRHRDTLCIARPFVARTTPQLASEIE
jgi:hypothetical protein